MSSMALQARWDVQQLAHDIPRVALAADGAAARQAVDQPVAREDRWPSHLPLHAGSDWSLSLR